MPYLGSAGYDAEYSLRKWKATTRFFESHLKVVTSIVRKSTIKKRLDYLFLDCTCGPGRYEINGDIFHSSDLRMSFLLDGCKTLECKGIFCEVDENSHRRFSLQVPDSTKIEVYNADFCKLIPDRLLQISQGCVKVDGLLYYDNNPSKQYEEHVSQICKMFYCYPMLLRFMDILLHISCCGCRRLQRSGCVDWSFGDIVLRMRECKKHVYIQEPSRTDRWKWTLLFCTNWDGFREVRTQNLWSVTNSRGLEIVSQFS